MSGLSEDDLGSEELSPQEDAEVRVVANALAALRGWPDLDAPESQ